MKYIILTEGLFLSSKDILINLYKTVGDCAEINYRLFKTVKDEIGLKRILKDEIGLYGLVYIKNY